MAGDISIFNDAIEGGLILTKFNLCCPDCDGPYSLSNYQDFEIFYEIYEGALANENDVGDICCLSIFADTEKILKFLESYGPDFPDLQHIPTSYADAYTQCGSTSDFMFYVNQLSLLLGDVSPGTNFIQFYVENFGIVEINTISGHSGLKFIYEFLLSTGLTQSEMQNMFMIIMGDPKKPESAKGLLIRCINDDILMSHAEPYYAFLENYFGSNLYLCLQTQRDRQGTVTTYTYSNILPEPTLVNGQPFYVINYNESGVVGKYYVFWSTANSRWEVWSGFNTTTNVGTGTFHSSLLNPSLDLFITAINWDDEASLDQGVVLDSSLKVECIGDCRFRGLSARLGSPVEKTINK
jgi:hypothetical protein